MYDEQVVPLVQLGNARALAGDIDVESSGRLGPRASRRGRRRRRACRREGAARGQGHASADFPAHWEAYQATYGAVFKAGDLAAAERAYPAAEKAYAVVDADLAKRARAEEAEALALDKQITDDFHSARTLTLIALILALLAGTAIATFIARGIKRGVDQLITRFRSLDTHDLTSLSAGLGAVAEGDLTVPVTKTTGPSRYGTDEIGVLSETFNAMLVKIHGGLDSYNGMRGSSTT